MEQLLQELNSSQQAAVVNTDGPVLVIAGAGSGKTRVLTYRIAYLLAQGVPSYKILALTFTNKAANEMKERITSIVGEERARDLWMGTFHSVFSKILRYEAQSLGFDSTFTIYDSQDSKSLINKIVNEMNLDKDKYKPGLIASIISKSKNNLITPEAYMQNADNYKNDSFQKIPQTGSIYKAYVNRCKSSNAMDFDDLLLMTNILFRDNISVLEKYQKRFKYILVDEFQDTNYSQNLIVRKLAYPENNICVVGDDAQSIYSFRGAKIENILNFSKEFPQLTMYKLEQNYRSTQTIVNAANSIIKKNSKQIPKTTFSELEPGNKIGLIETQTDIEEGYMVSKKILQMSQYSSSYTDFAILYRTNVQSRIFEEALRKYNIPCRIYGGLSFFQRKEIKDVLSYIRIVINPKDEEALARIINYPARGIGQTTVDKMTQLAQRNNTALWTVIANIELTTDIFNKSTITKIQSFRSMILGFIQDVNSADAYSLTHRIVEQSGIYRELQADTSIEGKNKFDNVLELLNGVKEFTEDDSEEIYLPQYIEKIALLTDLDSDNKDKSNKVTLMTIHSAKGLEFENCFIVGLEESLFPSFMNTESDKEIEEERRLFYVALTRAKKSATLSYATSRRKWGNLMTCTPSRFISEIDSSFIDFGNTPSIIKNKDFSFLDSNTFSKSQNSNPQKFTNFRKPATSLKVPKIENFIPDDPQLIQKGQTVLHATFGKGMVQDVLGIFPDSVAQIQFTASGEKKLLLKFAKLKVVND